MDSDETAKGMNGESGFESRLFESVLFLAFISRDAKEENFIGSCTMNASRQMKFSTTTNFFLRVVQ